MKVDPLHIIQTEENDHQATILPIENQNIVG